jgi:Holliday junction DNA helicase RuvA
VIAFLTGTLVSRDASSALLEVHGVGFRLLMSTRSLAWLPEQGGRVTVHTYLHVREDELTLYGFANAGERVAFEALLGVSGVGPKVALAVLSVMSEDDLAQAVATEDVASLSAAPGIGKKTAQRIILDLAGRLDPIAGGATVDSATTGGSAMGEVRDALLSMGFSAAETSAALKGASGEDASVMLRRALARLGGGS